MSRKLFVVGECFIMFVVGIFVFLATRSNSWWWFWFLLLMVLGVLAMMLFVYRIQSSKEPQSDMNDALWFFISFVFILPGFLLAKFIIAWLIKIF